MKLEFAIRDQDGAFFGLPARSFVSRAAANDTLHFLMQQRARMEAEATEAAKQLRESDLPGPLHVAWNDAIERWAYEEPRQWRIVEREATDWRDA